MLGINIAAEKEDNQSYEILSRSMKGTDKLGSKPISKNHSELKDLEYSLSKSKRFNNFTDPVVLEEIKMPTQQVNLHDTSNLEDTQSILPI